MSDPGEDRGRAEIARRRLRGFAIHLIAYFVGMTILLVVNFAFTPSNPWFLLPLVGWGAPLALHAAWAMGLFDVFRQ